MQDVFTKLEKDGEKLLGVRLGSSSSSSQVARLFSGLFPRGIILRGATVEEWRMGGLLEQAGSIHLYGPHLEGRGFFEALPAVDERALFGFLEKTGSALKRLHEFSLYAGGFHPAGIYYLADGGILVLPADLMDKINGITPIEERLARHEFCNHPDLTGEAAVAFALAVLAYRGIMGRPPHAGATADELRTAVRMQRLVPPHLVRTDLKEDVSRFLHSAIDPRGTARPNLEATLTALRQWKSEGVADQTDQETQTARRRRGLSEERAARRANALAAFRLKHTRTAVAAAAVLIVIGSVAASIISNALAPRVTAGQTAAEVVNTFYRSIASFDHLTMEDCVIDGAGAAYINKVMHLFVISRMRMSVEQINPFVDAAEWDALGRPVLPAGRIVFGVVALDISPEPAAEGEAAFTASFELWGPKIDRPPGDSEPALEFEEPQSEGRRIVERLALRRDGNDWVIYLIERLSEQLVEAPRS